MKILVTGATGFIGSQSRVGITDQIVQAMAEAPGRPGVFISSSATIQSLAAGPRAAQRGVS